MRLSRHDACIAAIGGTVLAGTILYANGTRFSDINPLVASAGPIAVGSAAEAMPIRFGNEDFEQRSVADRATQIALGIPNTGSFDMITTNETGPHQGRYAGRTALIASSPAAPSTASP